MIWMDSSSLVDRSQRSDRRFRDRGRIDAVPYSSDDYVPTGFRGLGVEHRAVPGHTFGHDLAPDEKRALIAFLRTL